MARVPRTLILAALVALPFAHAQGAEVPTLHYTVRPVLDHGDLATVAVEMQTQAGPDGTLDVILPGKPGDVTVEGGLTPGKDGHLVLKAAPGALVTLRYQRRVNDDLFGAWEANPYMATAAWGQGPCRGLLAIPSDVVARRIDLRWQMPARWRAFSTLPTDRAATPVAQQNSACFLGRDVVEVNRRIGAKGLLRVFTTDPKAAAPLADLVGKLLTTVAVDSGSDGIDYRMYLAPMAQPGDWASSWSNGSGFTAAVMQRDFVPAFLAGPIVNEYAAMLTTGPASPASAWYTQGMRSWLIASDLLGTHALPRKEIAAYLDQMSAGYGNSPFRRADSAQIASDWERSPDVQSLAAARGAMFGWLLDDRIRKATAGNAGLADALRGIGAQPGDPAVALIAAVKATGGGDISPLYEKYIVHGELIQLPPDAMGPCMALETQTDPYGWQIQRVSASCTAAAE
ncbi:MAG: hypothetical protein WBW32_04910 [Luteibacter sp.]